jgi:hypothetical protein
MRFYRTTLLLAGLALALLPAAAPAQSESGHSRFTPWSGYWWPHRKGGLSHPLQMYSRYLGSNQALNWELKKHPPGSGEKWSGFCHAWSASSVREPEPTRPKTIRTRSGASITLSVGDQKGLLAAVHASDDVNSYGHRSETNDVTRPEYIDLTPDQLWRYLKLYVKQQGLPLVMDLSAGREVWNYPVYSYSVRYSAMGGSDYRGVIMIHYAEDNVGPNYVGTKVGKRVYHCTFKMSGGSVVAGSGRWVGPSVKDHPDFAWYPYVAKSENPNVDYATVKQMLGLSASFSRGLDDSVSLPEPMDDPENPPAPIAIPGDEGPRPQPKAKAVTVSPAELMALVADKRSKFNLAVQTSDFNGMYREGDAYKINVLSEKPGYLYLLHADKDGRLKLLFPVEGQDNKIPPGGKKVEYPGPKDDFKFVCEAVGDNRVKAVVTSKPLNFTGLDTSDDEPAGKKKGQGLSFFLPPETEEQVLALLNKDVLKNDDKREKAARETKADPAELLGDFAQGEVTFYVDRAPKE